MTTLQQLREIILELTSDGEAYTRQELISYAKKQFDLSYYDADQRTTSAIKSLIKQGDLIKLEKGVYQISEKHLKQVSSQLREIKIEANKSQLYSDLPEVIRTFWHLENNLKGEPLGFSHWVKTMCEINADFDDTLLQVTNGFVSKFYEVEHSYGREIAQTLYNSRSIVLESELMSAALYLKVGGNVEDLTGIANAGFFMDDKNYDEMVELLQKVNSHSDINSAIDSIINDNISSHSAGLEPTLSM